MLLREWAIAAFFQDRRDRFLHANIIVHPNSFVNRIYKTGYN
ncbi:MAG TPA: hypothetical protein V6D33_12650 [Cyanophyceae cyanobacterium]